MDTIKFYDGEKSININYLFTDNYHSDINNLDNLFNDSGNDRPLKSTNIVICLDCDYYETICNKFSGIDSHPTVYVVDVNGNYDNSVNTECFINYDYDGVVYDYSNYYIDFEHSDDDAAVDWCLCYYYWVVNQNLIQ